MIFQKKKETKIQKKNGKTLKKTIISKRKIMLKENGKDNYKIKKKQSVS